MSVSDALLLTLVLLVVGASFLARRRDD